MKHTIWLPIILTTLLTGCLSPVQTDTTTYVINSIPPSCSSQSSRHITLYVGQIKTDSIYDTPQMAYSTQRYQVAYYAKNSWASAPGNMLQPLMINALQNTHHFRSVIAAPTVATYHYLLNIQLNELLQDYTVPCGVLRLTMRAQLINPINHAVVANKQISVIEPLPQQSPYGGVIAANRATAKALRQIAGFCVKHTSGSFQ